MRVFCQTSPAARRGHRQGLFPGMLAVAAIFMLGLFAASSGAEAQTFRFNSVSVEGNQVIDDATIVGFARIPRGRAVSASELNQAFQRVSGTGFFRTVDFAPSGNRLVIRVQEYPILNRVNFEGNRRLDNGALSAIAQSRSGAVYSPAQAEADAIAIAEAYAAQGRLSARVTPRLIERSDGRVDLAFEVREGPVVEIQRISFVGNRSFSEGRLRNAIESAQAGRFSTLFRVDNFDERRISADRQVLQDFYLSRGFIDAQVLSGVTELTRERDGVFVTYTIREGQQYRLGNITVSSNLNEVADTAPYRAQITARAGTLFTPTLMESMIQQAERHAYQQGLRFVRAEPRLTRFEADGRVDVELVLVRGERVFIERIDVQGNTTTQDQVIRRQFRVAEGDPLNPREIREAAARIRELGYFSDVRSGTRQGSAPDQAIVDVQVDETTTGSLGFGVSYSINDGIGANISYNEANFLGRGQRVRLIVSTVSSARSLDLSFTEPAFLGRDLSVSVDVGLTATTPTAYARFATEAYRFSPSISFPISEYARLSLDAAISYDRIHTVDAAASARIAADAALGWQTTGSLGFAYTYDTRVRGPNPDSGFIFRLSGEVAGIDRQFARGSALVGYQQRILNGDVTLSAEAEVGAVAHFSGASRITERYTLDSRQFRGFRPYGVGPRDGTTGDGLGGNFFAVARLEAQFPLGLPAQYGLSGALFTDVGTLWGVDAPGGIVLQDTGSVRAMAGFGLLWASPIGPLRLNFTTPLQVEAFDRLQSFDFSISARF